jgi:ADP-dependent phosphofructokinase/glucokinase
VGKAVYRLALSHRLRKIVIHTREFVLIAFKPNIESTADLLSLQELRDLESSSFQKIAGRKLEALRFGVSCAGAYAASGKLKGRKFVEEEASKLQESPIGRKQLELFLKAFNGQVWGQGAYALYGEYILCMLPTLLSKNPITTVGLGDTIAAGIFLRELELDVQA